MNVRETRMVTGNREGRESMAYGGPEVLRSLPSEDGAGAGVVDAASALVRSIGVVSQVRLEVGGILAEIVPSARDLAQVAGSERRADHLRAEPDRAQMILQPMPGRWRLPHRGMRKGADFAGVRRDNNTLGLAQSNSLTHILSVLPVCAIRVASKHPRLAKTEDREIPPGSAAAGGGEAV
ncbi:MAG: hypothetical protein WCE44_13415 [Candidatus Velthaea sp.]